MVALTTSNKGGKTFSCAKLWATGPPRGQEEEVRGRVNSPVQALMPAR